MKISALEMIGYLVVLSLVPCVMLIAQKHAKLKTAQRYEGEVVEHIPKRDSDNKTTYALRVAYPDDHGFVHEFQTSSSSSPPARPIGYRLTVFHHLDQSDPDILVFSHLFLFHWIWLCVAVAVGGCLAAPYLLRYLYL